jgi:hypothetical protein
MLNKICQELIKKESKKIKDKIPSKKLPGKPCNNGKRVDISFFPI